MSTDAIIVVQNDKTERIVAFTYTQDGYIHRGAGAAIFKFLQNRVEGKYRTNGIGNLGAQLVSHFLAGEDNPYDVYIIPADESIHCDDAEYIYTITYRETQTCPTCRRVMPECEEPFIVGIVKDGAGIWEGTPAEGIHWFGRNRSKPLF